MVNPELMMHSKLTREPDPADVRHWWTSIATEVRAQRVDDEPAVALRHEAVLALLEVGFGDHGFIMRNARRAARDARAE